MNNFECELVNDLLPSYIEKKTSAETNQFIEEHFKSCEACKAIYEAMASDVVVESQPEVKKKKFRINSIGKMILIVLGYLVIVVIALVIITCIFVNGVF